MGRSFEEDPLTLALRPPEDESAEARAIREQRESQARLVSAQIDEQIGKEKRALAKKKKPVKVLLLGQAESGKSTTLKNFQLVYAKTAWLEERASWKAIVQLNLVRNVTTILSVLSQELSRPSSPVPGQSRDNEDEDGPPLHFTDKHQLLKLRLAPLRGLQKDLERRLGATAFESDYEPYGMDVFTPAAALPSHRAADGGANAEGSLTSHAYAAQMPQTDFFVRSSNGWKSALDKLAGKKARGSGSGSGSSDDGQSSHEGAMHKHHHHQPHAERDEVEEVLSGCRDDITAVWEDEVVRELLKRRAVRMEDAPGFFLNDAARIATRGYEPSDDDVIRARLRTLGVQEHRFVFDAGRAAGTEWLLYDVGGHRSARAAWAPYFDDVDAVLFLAPVSCFDEKLAEDHRVNRLEDTYLLWMAISKNKLLARTQIVLFLNKIDLLKKKLKAGILIKDHVPSYGDRANEPNAAVKYFQTHFKEIAKTYNPEPRPFFVHLTSVIDTRATAATLAVVEEGILRDHLKRADLL